jgi:hypothetical protein
VRAASGAVVSAETDAPVDTFVLHPWVPLDPGKSAVSLVTWFPPYCGAPSGPYRLTADLPHAGGRVTETIGAAAPACPAPGMGPGSVTADAFNVWSRDGAPSAASPLADLTFIMVAPTTTLHVHAGDVLRYDVSLAVAPGLPALRLDPCPAYRESLVDAGGAAVVQELHLLNCAALPTIPSGSTVDYAMELRVSASVRVGSTLMLRWETFMGRPSMGDAAVVVD